MICIFPSLLKIVKFTISPSKRKAFYDLYIYPAESSVQGWNQWWAYPNPDFMYCQLKHGSLRGAVNFCMQKFLLIGRIGIFLPLVCAMHSMWHNDKCATAQSTKDIWALKRPLTTNLQRECSGTNLAVLPQGNLGQNTNVNWDEINPSKNKRLPFEKSYYLNRSNKEACHATTTCYFYFLTASCNKESLLRASSL